MKCVDNEQMILALQIGVYLIATQVTLPVNGFSVKSFKCDYEDEYFIDCELPDDIDESNINNTLMKLPDNLPNSTEHLEIICYLRNETTIGTRFPFQIDKVDVFKRLTSLQFLMIVGSRLEISEELRESHSTNLFKKELFNISSLKVLAMSIVMPTLEHNITDNMQWILPKNLISLAVEKTVMNYDLRACSKLEEIVVSSSPLTKLPLLHMPNPPIKRLRFIGCPLTELVVEDLARFCQLEYLTINSLEEPFDVIMDKCECFKLLQWTEKLTRLGRFNFSGDLPCKGAMSAGTELCHNSSLSEAIRLRMKCLGGGAPVITFFGVAIIMLPFVFAFSIFIRSFRKTTHPKPTTTTTTPAASSASMGSEMTSNSLQPEE